MGASKAGLPCNVPKWALNSPTYSERARWKEEREKNESDRLAKLWETNTFPLTFQEYIDKLENDIVALRKEMNDIIRAASNHRAEELVQMRRRRDEHEKSIKDHNNYVKKVTRERSTLARRIKKLLEEEQEE